MPLLVFWTPATDRLLNRQFEESDLQLNILKTKWKKSSTLDATNIKGHTV